jgi:hypothetical protein
MQNFNAGFVKVAAAEIFANAGTAVAGVATMDGFATLAVAVDDRAGYCCSQVATHP